MADTPYDPQTWIDFPNTTTPTSAARLQHMEDGIAAAYKKPSTNIPKTDLASAVQASLDKADSATQGGYIKPGTNIPKTDLATTVQTSLGKADSALQPGGAAAALADPGEDRLRGWDESANSEIFFTLGAPLSIAGTTVLVNSASTTDKGVARFATAAETTAGASSILMVSPFTLAQVVAGISSSMGVSAVLGTSDVIPIDTPDGLIVRLGEE